MTPTTRIGDCVFHTPFRDLPELPPLNSEERERLKQDIRVRGLLTPVIVVPHPEFGFVIIDGHHRLDIAAELGLTVIPMEHLAGERTEEEKRETAIALNAHRRHLAREQKQVAIEKLLTTSPRLSDRSIAKQVGASHRTVASLRKSSGQLAHSDERLGRDGRVYRVGGPYRIVPSNDPAPQSKTVSVIITAGGGPKYVKAENVLSKRRDPSLEVLKENYLRLSPRRCRIFREFCEKNI
jgi:hypothetical protein